MAFSDSFFDVSAQLIPVLFLAMVVEERLQPGDSETPGDRVARSWALALLVLGETLSLAVVAGGIGSSRTTGSTVSCAMLFGALLIVVPVLEREINEEMPTWERRAHLSAGVFVLLVVLISIIAVSFT